MRKEVRFGLAIGAVLLAVLIVYVLVVPGEPAAKPIATNTGAETPQLSSPTPIQPTDTPAPTPEVRTTQTPSPGTDPFASSTAPGATTPPPSGSQAATTPRLQTPPQDKWNVLDQGPDALLMATGPDQADAPSYSSTPTAPTTAPAVPVATRDTTPTPSDSGPTESSAGAPRTYVIKSGDTPSSIAKAFYGSANFYPYILRANPSMDPKRMKVGSTIIIPPIEEVRPTAVVQPSGGATPASSTEGPALDPARQYRVVKGDSLHRIAMRLYGSADKVQDIYQLNRETIGPDPAVLKLGMILNLPEAPTIAQAR